MIAVVSGMIATYPVGGMLWDYGQYIVGLEQLGFDVYYLEDTGLPSYHPNPPRYLNEQLIQLSGSLADRWHYRADDGTTFGLSQVLLDRTVASADLFLNVSGGGLLRDSYMGCSCKVLIDTDPGLNHFVNFPKWDRSPGWQGTHGYRGHDWFFTYAENIGHASCLLPSLGLPWHPTRPPVVTGRWLTDSIPKVWTTVMSWSPYQLYKQPITYQGQSYGAKEVEFAKFASLPKQVHAPLELALAGKDVPHSYFRDLGWQTIDAKTVSASANDYRSYVQSSRGEFSVAKNVYVATVSGWFSTRSVCYLAAGRPVVLQDTGYSQHLPVGEGLLAFSDLEGAATAIDEVESRYERHRARAREIAADCFEARIVIDKMLRDLGRGR